MKPEWEVTISRSGKRGQFYRLTTQFGGTRQCRTKKTLDFVVQRLEREGGIKSLRFADATLERELRGIQRVAS